MDGINGALFFQLPVFFVAAGIVAVVAWYDKGAPLPQQARAFRNGRLHPAAVLGLLALGLTLVSLPLLWGWAIFRPAVR